MSPIRPMKSERTAEARPRAVIYLRVSTREQASRGGEAEGFSIPAQRDACLRKAEALGAEVVEQYVDAGESARSANRPQLQEMLTFVAAEQPDYVIVHKVDRLARNRVDDVEINVALTTAGCQLVSCSENIDETPSGMLLHGIMSSIAEFYSRNLATETKKGLRQKAMSGGTTGVAPFGYVNVRERNPEGREVRTVAVDPERAPWVVWMFEQYATGEWTSAMLAEELASHKVTALPRPRSKGGPLAVSYVGSIIQNRYYTGVVTFEGVEYPGKHPVLVSEELFQRVQAVRQGRVASQERPRVHTHYLKGSVFCGECGEPLTFEQTRNGRGVYYDYFYCLGRQRRKNGCSFRAIQARVLEDLVEDHWQTITLPLATVDQIRESVSLHIRQVLPERDRDRQDAQAQLADLQRESDRLLRAHLADAVLLDQLKREQGRIAIERGSLESRLNRATIEESRLFEALERICELLASGHALYRRADDLGRRDLNQAVFERISIHDDEVRSSDLTLPFHRVLSSTLESDLKAERLSPTTGSSSHVGHLRLLPDVSPEPIDGRGGVIGQVRRRIDRTSPSAVIAAALESEETKNSGPSQVRSSNESFLVAGTGFEPVTSGL